MSSTWTGRLAALFFVAIATSSGAARLEADVLDRFGPAKLVHLETILKNPKSYINTTMRIPVRFNDVGSVFAPVYTRFTSSEYLNFSAWSVRTKIWLRSDLSKINPYFFVRKDNPEFKTFLRLKRFETVILLVRFQDMLGKRACFDVVAVTRIHGSLTQEELLQIRNMYQDLRQRNYEKALEHLNYLMNEVKLPKDLRARMARELALVYMHGLRDYKRGRRALLRAVALNPGDRGLERLLHWIRHHKSEKTQEAAEEAK